MVDVLLSLTVVILSQCVCILNHHIAYLKKYHAIQPKHIQSLFVNHTSKINKTIQGRYYHTPPFLFLHVKAMQLVTGARMRHKSFSLSKRLYKTYPPATACFLTLPSNISPPSMFPKLWKLCFFPPSNIQQLNHFSGSKTLH